MYAYELTGNDTLKTQAIQYTNLLNPVRYYKGTHDLGFMVNCSYGNAERLSPNDTIAAVMRETADNLCGRFNDSIGAIRSWDFGTWNFPVIIDNMMNLDLLFNVAKATGDNKYKDIAIKHAMTTMNNHFRPDYTCWHVVATTTTELLNASKLTKARMTILHGHVVKHGLYMATQLATVKQTTVLS